MQKRIYILGPCQMPAPFCSILFFGGIQYFFKRKIAFIYFSRDGRKGEREGEKLWCVTPKQGPSLQLRHVPWPGIEPATFGFAEQWHPTPWATPIRASVIFLKFETKPLCSHHTLLNSWHVYPTSSSAILLGHLMESLNSTWPKPKLFSPKVNVLIPWSSASQPMQVHPPIDCSSQQLWCHPWIPSFALRTSSLSVNVVSSAFEIYPVPGDFSPLPCHHPSAGPLAVSLDYHFTFSNISMLFAFVPDVLQSLPYPVSRVNLWTW